MENESYSVILHFDPENIELHKKVAACLARLDPTAAQKLQKKSITGQLIVKRYTDLVTAKRLTQILTKTGAQCAVVKLSTTPPPANGQAQNSADLKPSSGLGTDPRFMRCPNCGLQQPPAIECRECGILFSKARPRHPRQESVQDEPSGPDKPQAQCRATSRIMEKVHQTAPSIAAVLKVIQHPIKSEKLTSWARRVADRGIRCAMVFGIALILQIGMLSLGKMLWFLYVSTTVGQYYLHKLPEKAEQFQRIVLTDSLALGWDTTLTALYVGFLLGCAAQILHLIRYLYESQGIIGKLVLWFAPSMGVTAWIISQQHPYPELFFSFTLAVVPILCMLSSCLYLAQILLPELGDFRKIMAIILENRENTWGQVVKKIRIWLDSTKKVY